MQHTNLGYCFTVIVDNGFQDREFVLRNEAEVVNFGISMAAVKGVIYGWTKTIYGMTVRRVSLSQVSEAHYRYQDIQKLFNQNRHYFSLIVTPIIGTVIAEGPYLNTQFSFFSHHEHQLCFNKQKVRLALHDPLFSHRGCLFRTSSVRDAIACHAFLNDALITYLKTHFSGRGCNQHLPTQTKTLTPIR